MWHLATAAPTARVLDALAALPALQKVTFVVQTQVGLLQRGHECVHACEESAYVYVCTLSVCAHRVCLSVRCARQPWRGMSWRGRSCLVFALLPWAPTRACAPTPPLQREEAPSVEVAALMLELPRRCPALELAALDSEQFYGITIADLDSMAEEDGVAAGAAAGEAGAGLRGQQAAAEVLE